MAASAYVCGTTLLEPGHSWTSAAANDRSFAIGLSQPSNPNKTGFFNFAVSHVFSKPPPMSSDLASGRLGIIQRSHAQKSLDFDYVNAILRGQGVQGIQAYYSARTREAKRKSTTPRDWRLFD
ncbi:hypothetical protein BD410DRAFT_793386 [Rickenella mellea]|uniref:Uncharacterized protein n=1 Tax=Rickenella mellea TaxID=50990 RepID=A0A4Y7PUY6_9AGAM|nr:hypothetical protein BD410DRAFT_793386 [Rickenella mellea]